MHGPFVVPDPVGAIELSIPLHEFVRTTAPDSRGGQPNTMVAKVRKGGNENGRQPLAVALCFVPSRRSSLLDGVPVSDSTRRIRCSE